VQHHVRFGGQRLDHGDDHDPPVYTGRRRVDFRGAHILELALVPRRLDNFRHFGLRKEQLEPAVGGISIVERLSFRSCRYVVSDPI